MKTKPFLSTRLLFLIYTFIVLLLGLQDFGVIRFVT